MKTPFAIAACCLLASCGGLPEVRPHAMAGGSVISPFDQAYGEAKRNLLAHRDAIAIVFFERALELNPASVAALNGIGVAYDDLHRPDVAKPYYIRALFLEPDSADTLNNMAVSAKLDGDSKAARALFARAAILDPKNPVIADNMRQEKDPTASASHDPA